MRFAADLDLISCQTTLGHHDQEAGNKHTLPGPGFLGRPGFVRLTIVFGSESKFLKMKRGGSQILKFCDAMSGRVR